MGDNNRRRSRLIERRFNHSGLPEHKDLKGFDWGCNPRIPKRDIFEFATLKFVDARELDEQRKYRQRLARAELLVIDDLFLRRLPANVGDKLGDDVKRILENPLDKGFALSAQREKLLEARAAQEREKIPKFEKSAQADIARVFIDDLTRIRKDYLELVVQQVVIRQAAKMGTESLLEFARERISVVMEYLSGQVTLDAMSLGELCAQLADEPLDEDVKDAFGLVQAKQRRNLHQLDLAVDLAERVGLPVAEQQGLLVRERGEVGIELLLRDVFEAIWADQFSKLRQSFVHNGPDLWFRFLLF